MIDIRIGQGYDVHRLAAGRSLRIGGVDIPHTAGSLGHSDADVLLHALCDALLGALALGDIGQHFPDTDSNYKDIDSRELLTEVYKKVKIAGYVIMNIDAWVCLERPKIATYIGAIREQIATLLDCSVKQVSVKATTGEQIGFVGREEGLAAQAIVLLSRQHR